MISVVGYFCFEENSVILISETKTTILLLFSFFIMEPGDGGAATQAGVADRA